MEKVSSSLKLDFEWPEPEDFFCAKVGGRPRHKKIKLPDGALDTMFAEWPEDVKEDGSFDMVGVDVRENGLVLMPDALFEKILDSVKTPLRLREERICSFAVNARVDKNTVHIKLGPHETTLGPNDFAPGQIVDVRSSRDRIIFSPTE